MDGVGAVLVRAIDVAEQEVRYRRVGAGNLEPNAAAFSEAPGVRQQRDFELITLSWLERRLLGMGVDRNVVGADPAVALPVMRCAQPTLGDDAIARLDALGAVLGRLSELLGHLDDDVHVVASCRAVDDELAVTGEFEVALQRLTGEGERARGRIGSSPTD